MMGLYADFLMQRNLRFDFVTAEDIGDFAAWLSADHTTAVVDRTLCAVRRFYAWCDDERLAPNVAKGVEAAERCRSYSKKPISSADARRIIGSCDDDRSRAVCSLLIRAALKPGEVLSIDVGDVMLSKSFGEIRLRSGGYAALTRRCIKDIGPYVAARLAGAGPSSPLIAGSGNRNSGGRLSARSIRLIAAEAFGRAGLQDGLGDYSAASVAVELALEEREPAATVLFLADRTNALRRTHANR